jgi:FkbM family methyltransferase
MKSALLRKFVSRGLHERIRGGYRLAKFLSRDLKSVPIAIGGETLFVDLRGLDAHALSLFCSSPLSDAPHERSLKDVFARFIKRDDVVFDVGANLGVHTLTFSSLAKQVIAFEPNPGLLPNLKKTVTNLPNANVLDVCLSKEDGEATFHLSQWDHMLGSLANWTGQPTTAVTVPTRSIDSLIATGDVPRPDVMKVDVEGAELFVFAGAEELLSSENGPRVIIFEELNEASERLGISKGAASEYLRDKGYSLFLITNEGTVPLPVERPFAANLLASRGDVP